jgi:hypothetical protein
MILRVAEDGTYIEADREGAEFMIAGMTALRDGAPGTVVSRPWINGEAVGDFRLMRVEDSDV